MVSLETLDLAFNSITFTNYGPYNSIFDNISLPVFERPNSRELYHSSERNDRSINDKIISEKYETDIWSSPEASPFAPLVSLIELHLFRNSIDRMPPYLYSHNSLLEYLELSNNMLVEWEIEMFSNNSKLKEIYLSHNSFHKLTDSMIKDLTKDSLRIVDLGKNNIQCSCSMKQLNKSVLMNYDCLRCSDGNEILRIAEYMNMTEDEYISYCDIEEPKSPLLPKKHKYVTLSVLASVALCVMLVGSVMSYRKRWLVLNYIS